MIVKVNCESDRVESPDAVASLFVHGLVIGTPRAESNTEAQNNTTYVVKLLYTDMRKVVDDAFIFCAARNQDCIAISFEDGTGTILGPRPEKYMPFNPAYFIE